MGSAEEFGPYVVYEQIGLGGMATVHRAETQGIAGFSKQVALKRMLPNVAADANLVKSFIREARLASNLRHANVAQTYDLGKVGETYFIAMELVPGRNLREVLKHCAATQKNMPLPIVLNIVAQIADALDYAHNLCDESGKPLGIIHRDVSPSNVILGEAGIVKLIDFGIAKASANGMQTMSGTIKGKFGYMAPEYLMGYIDARADLFALGVIAHELLSNRPLFQGKDDMDTLYRVKDMPVLPPSRFNPAVPPEVDNIVMTCLERDPDKRWQHATAVRTALSTESQRLSLIAHNGEVEAWLDRTFGAGGDEDDSPEISMSTHTMEMPQGSVPKDFLQQANDSMATLVRPQGSQPIQAQSPEGPPVRKSQPLIEPPMRKSQPSEPPMRKSQPSEPPVRKSQPIMEAPARANSPSTLDRTGRVRPSANVVPRGEWDEPATRADASAIDSLASSSLARRDDAHKTLVGAAHDPNRTAVDPGGTLPPGATIPMGRASDFSEETVANAAAMDELAMKERGSSDRASTSVDSTFDQPTYDEKPRAATADLLDTSPRRPKPGSADIRDDIPTHDEVRPLRDTSPTKPGPKRTAPMAAEAPRRDTPPPRPTPQPPPVDVVMSGSRTRSAMTAQPKNDIVMSGSRTKPHMAAAPPPPRIPQSGARTQPHMAADLEVGSSAIIAEVSVSDVLSDLGHRPNSATPSRGTVRPVAPARSTASNFLLMLLVLIVAGGAAAVVYFALPYLT